MDPIPSIDRRRLREAGAVFSLVALIAAAELIQPVDHAMSNVEQLRAAAAHPGALRISSSLILLAAMVAPVAVFALTRLVPSRMAVCGAALGLAGAVGLAAIAVHQLVLLGLAETHTSSAGTVLASIDHAATPAILIPIFALPLALTLLVVGLYRATFISNAILAIGLTYTVTEFLPSSTGTAGEIVHHALGLIAFGAIAARMLTARAQPTASKVRAAKRPAVTTTT